MGRQSAIGRHSTPFGEEPDQTGSGVEPAPWDQRSAPGSGLTRETQGVGRRTSGQMAAPVAPRRTMASRLRLAFTALLLVGAGYYGVDIAAVYLRYWQLVNEMKVDAELASSMSDLAIRQRLLTRVDQLDLPEPAAKFEIHRTRQPPGIDLSTRYEETLVLPFYRMTVTFTPHVTAQLPRN